MRWGRLWRAGSDREEVRNLVFDMLYLSMLRPHIIPCLVGEDYVKEIHE